MHNTISTVLAFIVAIGLLVVVHELGHYWVARLCGVKVLRFAVGFGPVIWSRCYGPDQTEWALCAIPLGGYVKMLDEREAPVPETQLGRAFNRQTLGRRSLVVAAGPAANLLLAVVFYFGLYMHGLQDLRPILGEPPSGTIAAQAGVEEGDLVLAVNGEAVAGWEELRWELLAAMVDGGQQQLSVRARDGGEDRLIVDFTHADLDALGSDPLRQFGFVVASPRLPPVIGQVVADMPAAQAGIRAGDRVVSINGDPVMLWRGVAKRIAEAPGQQLAIRIERRGEMLDVVLVPKPVDVQGRVIGRAGIAALDDPVLREAMFVTLSYPAGEAFGRALRQVWETSVFTLRMLGRMVVGDLSLKNISGPVTIAEYAGQSARLGLDYYVKFLALISISIGVLNLLPVPVLDGGHLMYYLAEFLYRKPLPEQVFEVGQRIGLAILMLMMGIALFNDLNRQFFG